MNLSFEFEGKKEILEDIPMPRDLHSKIMKRVFVASYGKYLIASTAILFVNFGVLVLELYRRFKEVNVAQLTEDLSESVAFSPAYLSSAWNTLYTTLPFQSIVATTITAALCAYMTVVIIKFHRNPQSIGFLSGFVR